MLAAAALPSALLAGDGQAVYAKSCKMCHGAQGQGNPALAKALGVAIPNLGSPAVQGKPDDELKKTVTEGKGKMKPVKSLSGSDARDVVGFVRTLARK
jgi:mono/diheme cytochrome c family protein